MNIRGLGGRTKRKYLRDLIRNEEVGMVCLQEAKCYGFGKDSCFHLWGSNDIEWVENSVINNARGIITMCRRNCFHMTSSFNGRNYFVIKLVNLTKIVWKEDHFIMSYQAKQVFLYERSF